MTPNPTHQAVAASQSKEKEFAGPLDLAHASMRPGTKQCGSGVGLAQSTSTRLIVRTAGSTRLPAALIKHTGRSSGRAYATPLRAYPTDEGFLIALGYGSDLDWVRNVLGSGRAELVSRGVSYDLTERSSSRSRRRVPSCPRASIRYWC